jgi:hypothetical protein
MFSVDKGGAMPQQNDDESCCDPGLWRSFDEVGCTNYAEVMDAIGLHVPYVIDGNVIYVAHGTLLFSGFLTC